MKWSVISASEYAREGGAAIKRNGKESAARPQRGVDLGQEGRCFSATGEAAAASSLRKARLVAEGLGRFRFGEDCRDELGYRSGGRTSLPPWLPIKAQTAQRRCWDTARLSGALMASLTLFQGKRDLAFARLAGACTIADACPSPASLTILCWLRCGSLTQVDRSRPRLHPANATDRRRAMTERRANGPHLSHYGNARHRQDHGDPARRRQGQSRGASGLLHEEIRQRGEQRGFRLISFDGTEQVIAHVNSRSAIASAGTALMSRR